VLNKVLH